MMKMHVIMVKKKRVYPQSGLDCTGSQVITGWTDETAFNYNENATFSICLIVPGGSCNLGVVMEIILV